MILFIIQGIRGLNGKFNELSTVRNRLGIFSAVLYGKEWTRIRELRFNTEWYNISTPFLSRDGKRLYFASDKPDGYGGSDLYYCDWKNNYLTDPVNMGPEINTTGNESYPFITSAGELFFSSDGHKGMGGKDIFFSRLKDGKWIPPVRLDPPVNSPYDDFGIITDSLISEGYFSSGRDKTIDIYQFKTIIPQIFYTDAQKENQYCFRLRSEGKIEIDTLNIRYTWDFGDGKKAHGQVVTHCFPGPGTYKIKLDLIDRATGKLFFSMLAYDLELKDYEQPYISSPDVVEAGDPVDFDGMKSFLPGYDILSYSWDFGDGSRVLGKSVKHTFIKEGEFNVNLGLKIKSLTNGIISNTGVSKKITAVNTPREKVSLLVERAIADTLLPDISKYDNARIKTIYSAETEFDQGALFEIEIITSKTSIGPDNNIFEEIAGKYTIREVFDPKTDMYSYFADEQRNLMATYPAYSELIKMGFKDVRIRLKIIKDPVDKELFNLEKSFGTLTDNYIDSYNKLTGSGYFLLDQIIILMNRYPDIRLEVGVYTDNTGSTSRNLRLSQTRANVMVNYLINRGINAKRLVAKGYGSTRPVASNLSEKGREQNRRVDFTVIN